ncbi:hypothetical protein Q1695_009408 [Nippostrongylus brasiliensis]|nr:hypothetical protein Q1695_009408 [Nippostrongylus brasiliensis]
MEEEENVTQKEGSRGLGGNLHQQSVESASLSITVTRGFELSLVHRQPPSHTLRHTNCVSAGWLCSRFSIRFLSSFLPCSKRRLCAQHTDYWRIVRCRRCGVSFHGPSDIRATLSPHSDLRPPEASIASRVACIRRLLGLR